MTWPITPPAAPMLASRFDAGWGTSGRYRCRLNFRTKPGIAVVDLDFQGFLEHPKPSPQALNR